MKLLNTPNGEAVFLKVLLCDMLFLRGAHGDKRSCGQIIWGLCRPAYWRSKDSKNSFETTLNISLSEDLLTSIEHTFVNTALENLP